MYFFLFSLILLACLLHGFHYIHFRILKLNFVCLSVRHFIFHVWIRFELFNSVISIMLQFSLHVSQFPNYLPLMAFYSELIPKRYTILNTLPFDAIRSEIIAVSLNNNNISFNKSEAGQNKSWNSIGQCLANGATW